MVNIIIIYDWPPTRNLIPYYQIDLIYVSQIFIKYKIKFKKIEICYIDLLIYFYGDKIMYHSLLKSYGRFDKVSPLWDLKAKILTLLKIYLSIVIKYGKYS